MSKRIRKKIDSFIFFICYVFIFMLSVLGVSVGWFLGYSLSGDIKGEVTNFTTLRMAGIGAPIGACVGAFAGVFLGSLFLVNTNAFKSKNDDGMYNSLISLAQCAAIGGLLGALMSGITSLFVLPNNDFHLIIVPISTIVAMIIQLFLKNFGNDKI